MTIKLSEIDPGDLADARAKRVEHVRSAQHVLDTCACAWPLVTYRNGGHHPECPRHIELMSQPRRRRGLDG